MRINQEFDDGDSCTVKLKDRFVAQEEDEKLWYDRAFGALRNIMKIKILWRPPDKIPNASQYEYFVRL